MVASGFIAGTAPVGAQQQTGQPLLLLSIDGTDRWMDRQTERQTDRLDCFIDHAPHT